MKVTTKGQVTIPREIRQKLGIRPHTEVEFVIEGTSVLLRKRGSVRPRGDRLVAHLRSMGRRLGKRMTTDEIMALTRGE